MQEVRRSIAALSAALALVCLLPVGRVRASVEMGEVCASRDRVFINFTSNHGTHPNDLLFRYDHTARALDAVRERLVRHGKIRPLPLLVFIPSGGFGNRGGPTKIALERNGELLEGDADGSSIGPCYRIFVSRDDSYESLLALTLALPRLSEAEPVMTVPDVSALKRSLRRETAAFEKLTLADDPVRSPDGRFTLLSFWKGGTPRFSIADRAIPVIKPLPELKGYLAVRPVWSADSRYVAFASLQEIKLFDTRRGTTETVPLSPHISQAHEIRLAFDTGAKNLVFSGFNEMDTSRVCVYDLARRESRTVEQWQDRRPPWPVDGVPVAIYTPRIREYVEQSMTKAAREDAQRQVDDWARMPEAAVPLPEPPGGTVPEPVIVQPTPEPAWDRIAAGISGALLFFGCGVAYWRRRRGS